MVAAAPTDTPILNRLRRAPRDAVVADETPTLESGTGPPATFLSPRRPARWTDYGAAAVEAGATLSGLVFVATSINLNLGRILAYPSLPRSEERRVGKE